jgi:5-oxoprolinase (ATP-hydrolysing)
VTPVQSLVVPDISLSDDDNDVITQTTTGEAIRILQRPDPEIVGKQLDALWGKGIKSLAIAFVHSFLWGEHEELVAKIAREKGFEVSVSSQLQPMVSQHFAQAA